MEIAEASIRPERAKPRKVSKRVFRDSAHWLEERGLELDELTEPQQKAIFDLIKKKRGLFWLILIAVVSFIFYSVIIGWFYQSIIKDTFETWAPTQYVVEDENGEEVVQEIPPELQDSIRSYGKLIAILSIMLGLWGATAATGIGTALTSVIEYKRSRKMIEAFLPRIQRTQLPSFPG